MPPASRVIPPEERIVIRDKYENGSERVGIVCDAHGISENTLYTWARRENWRMRRDRLLQGPPPQQATIEATPLAPAAAPAGDPAALPAAPAALPAAPAPPSDDLPLVQRLQLAVERQLAAVEAIIAGLGATRASAGESERTARALATLARILRELNVLQTRQPEAEADADADSGPHDIDAFRDALARKIDALIAARGGAAAGETQSE